MDAYLQLRFGIFRKRIFWENISKIYLDSVSLKRIGGAGIHWSSIQGKYRMMFNFLEYNRVVIDVNGKIVKSIMFSTKNPELVMNLIQEQM